MATISFSRISSGTVRYSASGLVLNVDYEVQVYSSANGRWYAKDSFTAERTSASGTFTVDTSSSYSGRLYDATNGTSLATATIPAYTEVDTVTMYAQCTDGVERFTIAYGSSSQTVYKTSGVVSFSMTAGVSVTIRSVYTSDGYSSPYLLYYNTASDPYGYYGPREFTSSTTIDSSFDRRIKVGATQAALYPYRQMVYVDDTLESDTTNSTYAEDTIVISDLSNYSSYVNRGYTFQYARIGSSSVQRGPSYAVPLTANSTTIIRLYFTAPTQAVKPTITNVSMTSSKATIYWSKNGGSYGSWRLFYGTSASNLQMYSTVSSSPAVVSGLSAGTTYIFMIKNWVSATDYKDSDTYSAKTQNNISSFAWTSSDATLIVSGAPVSNITAAAWRNLASCVNSVRQAAGSSTIPIPSVSSGSQITASLFNTMRGYIAGLSGAGSVVGSVTSGGTVYATYFANSTSALKEAVNRAIANANL